MPGRLAATVADETHPSDQAPTVYRIDGGDTIVFVDEPWRAFARANGAPELADGAVDHSVWEFVAGMEVTLIWQEILARARGGKPVSFPYRCDSPAQRRLLLMEVKPLQSGGVEFVSSVSRIEDRDPVALLAAHYADGTAIRSCSWCRRFDAGGFVEVEEAIERLGLLEQEMRPITHTICEGCSPELLAAL